VVDAFIAALRAGDLDALVAVLGGNQEWARGAITYRRATEHMHAALVDGAIGLVFAPHGKLSRALVFDFAGETIRSAEVITDPDALAELSIENLS
jgi:RNA polymerase sigma-70 factor (ECF subfamily)